MIRVFQDRDRVVLDPCGRWRDKLLGWREAERLVAELRMKADRAELEPATLVTEVWAATVESYDGFVALRITPPEPGTTRPARLPVKVARKLADLIEFKSQQAAYKMRFVFA